MKTNTINNFRFGCIAVLFALAFTLLPFTNQNNQAFAAGNTCVWTGGGGDDNFSTAANWSPAVAPVTGDDLVFDTSISVLGNNPFNDSQIVPNDITISNQSGNRHINLNSKMFSGTLTSDGSFTGNLILFAAAPDYVGFLFPINYQSTTIIKTANSYEVTNVQLRVTLENVSTVDLAQFFGAPLSLGQDTTVALEVSNASEVDVTLTGIYAAFNNQVTMTSGFFDTTKGTFYDSNAHLKFASLTACRVVSTLTLSNTDDDTAITAFITETCNKPTPVVPPADPVVPDNTEYLPSTGDIVIVEALHIIRIAAIACILIMLHRGFCMRRRVEK